MPIEDKDEHDADTSDASDVDAGLIAGLVLLFMFAGAVSVILWLRTRTSKKQRRVPTECAV